MTGRKRYAIESGVFPVLLGIALWEVMARSAGGDQGMLLPPPSAVLLELERLTASGALPRHLLASLLRVLAGLTLGSVAGIATGMAMGYSPRVRALLRPLVSLLCPIPALGWLPLLMIWVGLGELLPVLVIVICSFFPICYNTASGIENADPRALRAARTLGASELRVLVTIALPLALPDIFTGLRLEVGMAWRVIIAAEMVAIPSGLGALMMQAESVLRVDTILATLVVLSVMCFCFEKLLLAIERRLTEPRGTPSPCATSRSSTFATTPAAE